jgi:hypothetical protein
MLAVTLAVTPVVTLEAMQAAKSLLYKDNLCHSEYRNQKINGRL